MRYRVKIRTFLGNQFAVRAPDNARDFFRADANRCQEGLLLALKSAPSQRGRFCAYAKYCFAELGVPGSGYESSICKKGQGAKGKSSTAPALNQRTQYGRPQAIDEIRGRFVSSVPSIQGEQERALRVGPRIQGSGTRKVMTLINSGLLEGELGRL